MARILSQEEIDAQFGGGFRADVAPAGLGTRFGAAIDRSQAGLLGIGEAVGLPLGDLRRENQFEQQQSMQRYFRDNPNEPQSYRDVEGVGSALRYARGLAIDSSPELLTSLASGGAGAVMGLGRLGRVGLAAATNYPAAVGDILQNQREEAGQTNAGVASLLGVPYAAADLVGLDAALASGRMARTGIRRLDEMQGVRGALARTGANVALNAPVEGASETFQELVNQAGRMAVNPRQTMFNDEANERYLESFVGGATLGGAASGVMGGWRRSEQYQAPEQETDLLSKQTQQAAPKQYGLVTQPAPLQQRINQQLGIGIRNTPKDYVKQFTEAYNEPSGQYATDPVTGIEKQLSVGEYQQITNAPLDLTQAKPADAAAATAVVVKTERDPRSYELRDTFGVIPTPSSLQLYSEIQASGVPVESPILQDVWNYAAEKPMTQKRLEKAQQLLDAAIINARKGAPSGTPISTGLGTTGGVGVGSPDVQGTVGTAGSVPPVTGTVDGAAATAGAPLQQVSTVPSTTDEQPAAVTPPPANAPVTKFKRAPKPMTVLEAANAAKAAQAQQTETQRPQEPAAPVVDERQVVLQQIFGERNGDIIFDVVGMGMSEQAAAAKYNLKRSSIQAIAGATGQKEWPDLIAKAKAAKGLTDAQIADAFNTPPPDSIESQVARDVFSQGAERLDEGEAIEAGLENIVRTAGAGTSAVKGFTKLQKEIDATLEALAAETDEAVLKELNEKLAAQIEKVRAVEEQAKAEVRANAGRKSEKDKVDETVAKAETPKAVGEEDAVQVESATGVPVQSETEAGEGVGEQVRSTQEPAGQGQVLTDREQAAQAWDKVASEYPEAPAFADLTKAQQQDFIDFGPDNWTEDDVNTELTKLAKAGLKFGKDGKSIVAPQPYTAKQLISEIKAFIRMDVLGRKLTVVDSVADLLTSPDKNVRAIGAALQLEGAYGVAVDGRAFLVANRIKQGQGRAKFMHEVGGHLGLDNLLTKAQFDKLVDQIKTWARQEDGSLETELALQAFERVQAAGTPKEDQRSELIAYFIESAMQMGVDPTGATDAKLSSPLREWFRTLWAAFKIAARKLGVKPETMTAQDVVNLAYGAARLEMNGVWHGTAATFRNFRNQFIGTGEGATAYGWGTYLAQRVGIAKGYWKQDVRRKTDDKYFVNGKPVEPGSVEAFAAATLSGLRARGMSLEAIQQHYERQIVDPAYAKRPDVVEGLKKTIEFAKSRAVITGGIPEGNLMRVDTAVEDNRMFDYDKPVIKQSNYIADKLMGLLDPVTDEVVDITNKDVEELTGRDLIGTGENDLGLLSRLIMDDAISTAKPDVQFDKAVRQGNYHEAASHLLRTLGIDGIKFFDAQSRGTATQTISYEGKRYNRDQLRDMSRDAYKSQDAAEISKFTMLRHILRNGLDATRAELEQKIANQLASTTEVYQDSAKRYNITESVEESRARAEKSVAQGYEAKQLEWLNANEKKISFEESPKTQNLIIFDDKNVQRVGSEAAANQQRMKFGGARFEGLPNKANPVLDEKVKAGNTNIDKAIRLLTRAAKEKDAATADALRAEAQKLFDSAASRMKFGKEASAPTTGVVQRNIAKLPKAAQQPVRNSLSAMNDAMGKGLDYLVFTSDLVDRATKSGMGSAKKFVDLIGKSKTEARENEIAVEKISDMYALVPEKDRGTGENSVNRFLFDSTREGKWGYGKFRDETMGNRFDSLSPESRAYVEAVFAHGSEVLAKKKKLVLDSTNSEYDAMIAAARADGDTATEVKLTKEKEATLKRFQTLFKIRDGIPYAPIKRNGSHVVIAKSKEYLAAEAANDTKKITELESNGDHYHVSFTDGKWEARNLQQDLNDQGFFADVQIAERDNVIDEMFSGHSALRELTKMRSRVDEQAKAGDKSASKMLSLISQMYLEALAEGSARKSEMRRRGVDGEVDMIRSFAQQGRADAHFMASVKYNPQVQKALQEMRTQMKTGDRERKSEIFNELAKRYMQSMDYVERPWLNKLTRMSSLYFLATSPAYYLQNLTQPWMMSVPAMAGKHNYAQASGALFKAYTELGGVMKSAKLLKQQFDFDKVPSDVRDAIKELVNRGKIDIGMDTEIGEFKVEGDGYFAGKISAADKALRLAVQKVESVNRLSTAMAAYRLELAKTGNKEAAIDYADRILTETHGDYTSFNAPRAFNTGVGKVALQFRKFQLIQLAFYAKLIRDSLQGADRAAAFKTLIYSLGHTGLLAGTMGMPGYAAIAWAVNALLSDEDDKYDLTNEIRKAIGDEQVANLVLRGAPTLVGADISGKVGAGNMLSIMPFSQADLTTTAGRAEALGTLIGGASLGMTTRMLDGLGLMIGGDWQRGIEQTMPKGVSDAMKAYRIANEGMTRRNGDIILPPDEVSSLDTVFQAIGIQPVKQTVTYERQTLMKETTQNFTERTTKIKNDYVKAAREGDSEAQGAAREAWKKLQEVKKREGVNTSPLSELLKAPAEQKKREKMTVGGVQYTKGTKKLAQEIAGD